MLDIKLIRENQNLVKQATANKQMDPSVVDLVLEKDKQLRELKTKIQETKAQQNKITEEIKLGDKTKVAQAAKLKEELKNLIPKLETVQHDFDEALSKIPNIPADDVKVGKNDSENEEIRKVGQPTQFAFTPKDHLEIGTKLGVLDFETGAKVAGSQFYYLYGDGALMELALIQFAFETLIAEGFVPVITPDLAKSKYYLGTGYAPRGDEAQTYVIKGEDIGLIATAEVTLAGKHADETIPQSKLPLKYVGYSHCFRQEAGAYGKYSKGLYRVHQFTKAEMFIYTTPEESNKYHDYLLKMEEQIYQALGIPYRVLKQCTGDLGAMAARKYDIEAWMPGRGEYGEVTSTSNCTDYQSRNLNIKYRSDEGKNEFVHMLNGTAIATSRTIIAILENYQQKDGSVVVPEVLRKWMGKDVVK